MLRIHEILVGIRIRRSMPLTNGSESCYFRHWPSKCQQKTNLTKKFFCLLHFEGTFTSFFKDKKVLKIHKTVGIKVFLLFLHDDDGSGSIPRTNISGSGRPKNVRIRIRNTETWTWIRILMQKNLCTTQTHFEHLNINVIIVPWQPPPPPASLLPAASDPAFSFTYSIPNSTYVTVGLLRHSVE